MTMSDEDWQPDADSLLALESEIPLLSVLREFSNRAVRARWFAELGEPFDVPTSQVARAYLDTLGFPDADALQVSDWDDALDAAVSLDLNTQAWEAEEQLRAALMDEVLSAVSEEGLGVMLAHLAAQLAEPVPEMVDEALMMADEAPDAIRDLAVGAAQQAAHGAALALLAAAVQAATYDDMEAGEEALNHPLLLRYRLFELGRWPLALTGRTLNLF
jgi:uncharacterized protein YidB (DUF937 family)